MKNFALPIAFGVLACLAAGVAKADPVVGSKTTDVVQPWTIKAGVEWSTSSGSPTLGIVGVDYAFEKTAASNNPVLPSIYFRRHLQNLRKKRQHRRSRRCDPPGLPLQR